MSWLRLCFRDATRTLVTLGVITAIVFVVSPEARLWHMKSFLGPVLAYGIVILVLVNIFRVVLGSRNGSHNRR